MPRHLCNPINAICFWGPQPVKSWKRPAMLAVSVPTLVGGIAFAWTMPQIQTLGGAAFCFVLLALGISGIVTSSAGCDHCVARLWGSI